MSSKHTISVIINGESAIFSLNVGTQVKQRAYCSSHENYAKSDAPDLFAKNPDAQVYVLLDTAEQNFTRQSMPGVSSVAVAKLVNKRLLRDYPADDLKGAVNCGREKVGRKDWRYLFVQAPYTEDVTKWLSNFEKLCNPFMGVYLLPLEARYIAKMLQKSLLKSGKSGVNKKGNAKKNQAEPTWTFLSLTQKSGGIRQVVLHHDHVYFTRYVRYPQNAVSDVISGVIEQEMLNTIDYLRRLSFKDDEMARAVIIASNEVKASLAGKEIAGMDALVYSPYEFSVITGMTGACRLDDKYADILCAITFLAHKPTLKLFTPALKKNNGIYLFSRALRISSMIMAPLFIGISAYLGWSIYSLKDSIAVLEDKKVMLNKRMKEEESASEHIDKEQATKIISSVSVWRSLRENTVSSPKILLNHVSNINDSSIKIKNFRWNYVPAEKRGRGSIEERESAQLSLDFFNKGKSPESLFKNFDLFSTRMNTEFSDHTVQYSRLPDKLAFDSSTSVVPVNITISPADEKKRR